MDAAEQLVSVEPDPLPWAEICARCPDRFVCLVDIVRPHLRRGLLGLLAKLEG